MARDLKEPTLYKINLLLRHLKEYAADKGLVYITDFNIDGLRDFRAQWKHQGESARVRLGNLKAFFRFCHESGWLSENPAAKIKAAKVVDAQSFR